MSSGFKSSPFNEVSSKTLLIPIFVKSSSISIPIDFLFSDFATKEVVNVPENGSNTKSPSLELALIIRSSKAIGFCVG